MNRILLLDSDKNVIRSLELFLKEEFHLKSTFHPNLALSILQKEKFDFLLTDIKFRNSQIAPFIRKVKNIQPGISVILMYTVFDDQESSEAEIVELADEVLNKPFDPSTLLNLLKKNVTY